MPEIPNSLFLDLTSYGTTTYTSTTRVEDVYHVTAHDASETVNVALILPRANDPTALLESDWATRQATLAELNANNTLWSTYGASPSEYAATVDLLTGTQPGQLGLTMIGDPAGSDGYISSPESRTIWLQLSPADFETLFGTPAFQSGSLLDDGLYFWRGNLSLPTGLDVAGLWFDFKIYGPHPAVSDLPAAPAPISRKARRVSAMRWRIRGVGVTCPATSRTGSTISPWQAPTRRPQRSA
ncbi:MAG: hypothetical protein GEU95_10615 [Rhizobiales bacterium]|nr:hypothetical protein [Hyphomicrobiales bacterium]